MEEKTVEIESAKGEFDQNQIKSDLQTSLSEHHQSAFGYPVDMKEYSVLKSMTDENTFTAQVDVLAESAFAEYQYIADVQYTKYDQGWIMDKCTWEFGAVNVVRYPDDAEMDQIKLESNVLQQKEISLIFDGGKIFYRGADVMDWHPFAYCAKEIEIKWGYNTYGDWWTEFYRGWDISNDKCVLSPRIEGEWSLGESDYATISNVTDNGFDISIKASHYKTDTFHVESGNINVSETGDCVIISFTGSNFEFQDPNYPTSTYGKFSGTANISMYLYKEKQMRMSNTYNCYMMIMVNNNSRYGSDVYVSELYCLEE